MVEAGASARLLSLRGARPSWSGPALAAELGTSTRTLRRDVGALRDLGYPVHADAEALHLTALRNYGEFPAPPLDAATLRAVAAATRRGHVLRLERLRPDGSRPDPRDDDVVGPVEVEPHHLVVRAARWYVVCRVPDPGAGSWQVLRLDAVHPLSPTDAPPPVARCRAVTWAGSW